MNFLSLFSYFKLKLISTGSYVQGGFCNFKLETKIHIKTAAELLMQRKTFRLWEDLCVYVLSVHEANCKSRLQVILKLLKMHYVNVL